jgi:hypothetical protein
MIRFETSISNPFVKVSTYKTIKESRKALFNRVNMLFQFYKYNPILLALELKASRYNVNAYLSVFGYSLFLSLTRIDI